jgi:hypothetical protein
MIPDSAELAAIRLAFENWFRSQELEIEDVVGILFDLVIERITEKAADLDHFRYLIWVLCMRRFSEKATEAWQMRYVNEIMRKRDK